MSSRNSPSGSSSSSSANCIATGTLDHYGEFYHLDFITPRWSPGPIDAPDPKVDIAAVNPWMLRMAGAVADGVHVHPLGEPGYLARHVIPNIAAGATKSGRSPSEIAVIVPVMTIVGDSDEERHHERELVRPSMSFYGSTPNYAFIFDEAGFEGTTARIREKQKAGDFKGMAAQITDQHIATFAIESTPGTASDALIEKYEGIATRIVLYNALGDHERFERYGGRATHIDPVTLRRYSYKQVTLPFAAPELTEPFEKRTTSPAASSWWPASRYQAMP